jgi:hypothetical protein
VHLLHAPAEQHAPAAPAPTLTPPPPPPPPPAPAWQDLEAYNKTALALAKKYFTIDSVDDFYRKKDPKPLIFCHFARGLADKTYDEVRRAGRLAAALRGNPPE